MIETVDELKKGNGAKCRMTQLVASLSRRTKYGWLVRPTMHTYYSVLLKFSIESMAEVDVITDEARIW